MKEQRQLIEKICNDILIILEEKVASFDDSLNAINDFIEFINTITEMDKVIYAVFYGWCKEWVVPSLCSVLTNRKLFMIYWSRHLGQNIASIGCTYLDSVCKELVKRNELPNIRLLLNTQVMVEMIDYYYVGPGFQYNWKVLSEKTPELIPYIDEIRSRIINEKYKGEDEYMWADESKQWFESQTDVFTAHRHYYSFSCVYDL
jgi:hypothetical protein